MSQPKRKATDILKVLAPSKLLICRDGSGNQPLDSLVIDELYLAFLLRKTVLTMLYSDYFDKLSV